MCLTHPFSWSEDGYDNINNFTKLIRERNEELLTSMDDEDKNISKRVVDIKN